MIRIKRIYEASSNDDGYRILVDRLWPRGLSKDKSKVDLWLEEIAPSDELRKWFAHDPRKWQVFREKYEHELKDKSELMMKIRQIEVERKIVTLLYSAKDEKHNNGMVLRNALQR